MAHHRTAGTSQGMGMWSNLPLAHISLVYACFQCVCERVCVCVYVFIYIYIYIYIYTYIHAYVCVYVCVYACIMCVNASPYCSDFSGYGYVVQSSSSTYFSGVCVFSVRV